ncbi:MAG: hypothetical protein H6Q90_3626 [Deltaproteobacteria bacterium]|nr:hypothetical protein [Deltaproteobacteria bacterium]
MSDDYGGDRPEPTSDHRVVAVVLAFAAAACFLFASFSTRWLFNSRTPTTLSEVGFGLRSNYECSSPKTCRELSNGELVSTWKAELAKLQVAAAETADNFRSPEEMRAAEYERLAAMKGMEVSSAFAPLGWITFISCLVAGLSLAIAGALVLAKRRLVLPIMPTTTALLSIVVALVAGCVFAALKPGPPGYAGVSVAFFVFGGGVVAGLASSLMLNKLLRPEDPDLLSDAMNPEQF